MTEAHGGELGRMAGAYGIARERWLDLSTGINPRGWPVPVEALADELWRRLPEPDDGLVEAATAYYGVPADCLAVLPGSQAGIQHLPGLFPAGRILVPDLTYNEHERAWRGGGHRVVPMAPDAAAVDAAIREHDDCRHALVVNPNNPTGDAYAADAIRRWAAILHKRGGCLVVDEAFADCDPAGSCLDSAPPPGLVVLRSVGKFFGLAGLRLGFAAAEPAVAGALQARLGPWPVNHPARYIGRLALADGDWQRATRAALADSGRRLQRLLREATAGRSPAPAGVAGCALFQSLHWPARAESLFEHCARHGVYIRRFAGHGRVRFGLPGDEPEWRRLERVLSTFE